MDTFAMVHNITCNDIINTPHSDTGRGGGADDDSESSASSHGSGRVSAYGKRVSSVRQALGGDGGFQKRKEV